MKNLAEIQERFLREDSKMRMGHLASDLARLASLLRMKTKQETIKGVMAEAKFFSEWAAQGMELEIQMLLSEIQSFLAQTELKWESLSNDAGWKEEVTRCLRGWSDVLLQKAGLVDSNE